MTKDKLGYSLELLVTKVSKVVVTEEPTSQMVGVRDLVPIENYYHLRGDCIHATYGCAFSAFQVDFSLW